MAIHAGAGDLISSRYRLEHQIARGSMGEVWEATDRVLGRRVAVKMLLADLARGEAFRERFRAEARAAARLTHPGVVSVYDYGTHDYGTDGSTLFLVMELVEGETVRSLLDRRGPLGAAQTMSIVAQAASVLAAAHELGLVHGDVQPANLLLQPDGRVKIADFGVARTPDAPTTFPEEAAGKKDVSVPDCSDVYHLGAVAYECLTGVPPFGGDEAVTSTMVHLHHPASALPPAVPQEVRWLVAEMLEEDAGHRLSTAALADIAEQLAESLDDDGLSRGPAIGPATTVADGGPRLPAAGRTVAPRRRRSRRGELQRGRIAVTASIAAAVVLVLGLALRAGATPSTVRVPALRGLLAHAASSSLAVANLTACDRIVDVAGARAHLVVGQRPRAGARVESGTKVVLTIASGYVVLVPRSLDGLSYTAALSVLRREGLRAAQLAVALGPGDAGRVVAFHPDGRLKEGTVVALSVAPTSRHVAAAVPATPATPAPSVDAAVVPSYPQPPPSPPPGHHHGRPGGPPGQSQGPPHGNGNSPPADAPSTPPPGATGPGNTPPSGSAGTTPPGGQPASSPPPSGQGGTGGSPPPAGTPVTAGTTPPSSPTGSGATSTGTGSD